MGVHRTGKFDEVAKEKDKLATQKLLRECNLMAKEGLHQLKSRQLCCENEWSLSEKADAGISNPTLRSELLLHIICAMVYVCECEVL